MMKRVVNILGFICLLSLTSLVQAQYSRDQPMSVVNVDGVEIAYTEAGDLSAPPVMLVMGLTASHRLWGEDFVNGIVDAGYRVVLFDNRDTGESARLDSLGTPTLWWQMLKATIGFDVDAPYSLSDMAADAIAVLDALGIEQAHIVGASMGGMIAQIIAADYPERTTSLVSIMSTTGAPHLPEAKGGAGDDLLDLASSEGDVEAQLNDMGMFPDAMPRQLMAIVSAGDRSASVATIKSPTLVLHGEDDNLLPPEHGRHTHEMIGGSKFVVYPGMGHNMPPEVVPLMLQAMQLHFAPAG
jgi:pimeloyl-ACP methyl ester carboxylesterase